MADTSTLQQLRKAYPWLWSTPLSNRWGSGVPAGWLPIMARVCERLAALVSDDAQHRGLVIDRVREKWGFLETQWRARGRGGPVERDDDPEVAAQIEKVVSAAQECSKRACAVCGRPGRLRREAWILTLCDMHAALHAEGRIPPAVLQGVEDPPMISTPSELLIAFPHQFPGGRPPLVARGWFPLVAELCREVDRVVGPQGGTFHWLHFREKLGALKASWEADLAPADRERVEALIRAAEEASARTCVCCGQPGQLHAHMDYLLPVCAEHARTRDAGRWIALPWLEADQPFDAPVPRRSRPR